MVFRQITAKCPFWKSKTFYTVGTTFRLFLQEVSHCRGSHALVWSLFERKALPLASVGPRVR